MDVWIETAAGNLVKASSITHIVMRESSPNVWEVSVSASAAPAPFATGLASQAVARTVRNTLALQLSTAAEATQPQVLIYDGETCAVTSCTLPG